MVHDHRASWPWHNMALWPRHGDNSEDIANPASLMVYKNILNSLLLNLRIFKFMNILMLAALRVWNIYNWSRDPAIFMARGCAGWVVWTHREWGWVIESYQSSSRLPRAWRTAALQQHSPAESAGSILWADFRGIYCDKRFRDCIIIRLRFCILHPLLNRMSQTHKSWFCILILNEMASWGNWEIYGDKRIQD